MVNPIRVVVTGAAGQIGYSILQPIALGLAFGPNQPVHIVLFDLPNCENKMKGVLLEIEDLASPVFVGGTVATTGEVAFKDADFIVCLAGRMALGANMTRAMLGSSNKPIYEQHGKLINEYARKTCKILVVANPCNSLCLVLSNNAPNIPRENFCSMSRLDQNRIKSLIALKCATTTSSVKGECVWGNHSSSMVPDVTRCVVTINGKSGNAKDLINDAAYWEQFDPSIQERALAIVRYRENTSALSSAYAAVCHIRDWFVGTPAGEYSSMGVYSDGSYGAPQGVFFSFPCVCKDGKWAIAQNLAIDSDIQKKIKITGDELLNEKKELQI